MAIHAGAVVRCPVYRNSPSRGFATGCGSSSIKRTSRTGTMDFLCNNCGLTFGSSEVEHDRKVLTNPKLRAEHNARISGGRYV